MARRLTDQQVEDFMIPRIVEAIYPVLIPMEQQDCRTQAKNHAHMVELARQLWRSFVTPAAPAAPEAKEDCTVDNETIKTLLDLLNPLHGEIDRQTYDQKVRENFDAPPDAEYNVDITALMERHLTQAVCILENRLRAAAPEAKE